MSYGAVGESVLRWAVPALDEEGCEVCIWSGGIVLEAGPVLCRVRFVAERVEELL